MDFRPTNSQRKMPRFLAPRVVIYGFILLAVAWVMWRMDKEPKPVRKPITMPEKIAEQNERTTPMLVLVAGPEDDLDDLMAQAQKAFGEKWQVTMVSVAQDSDVDIFKQTFGVEALPAAVLVSKDNQILDKVDGELSIEALGKIGDRQ